MANRCTKRGEERMSSEHREGTSPSWRVEEGGIREKEQQTYAWEVTQRKERNLVLGR